MKTHKEQIEWFLNAYWSELGEANTEKMWQWNLKCSELDLQNHENGNGLDELNAHRFLEFFNEPMTVREMRDSLRSSGAIEASLRTVPITHIILFKYKLDWKDLVNRSIANQAELARAQKLLEQVSVSISILWIFPEEQFIHIDHFHFFLFHKGPFPRSRGKSQGSKSS